MTAPLSACATPPDLTALETAVITREARLPMSLAGSAFGRSVSQAVTTSPTLGRGQAALREAEAGLLAETGAFLPQLSVGLRLEDAAALGGAADISLAGVAGSSAIGSVSNNTVLASATGNVSTTSITNRSAGFTFTR